MSSLFWITPVATQEANVSATVPALCGNGVVEGDEACDGGDNCTDQCTRRGGAVGVGVNAANQAAQNQNQNQPAENGDPVEPPVEEPIDVPDEPEEENQEQELEPEVPEEEVIPEPEEGEEDVPDPQAEADILAEPIQNPEPDVPEQDNQPQENNQNDNQFPNNGQNNAQNNNAGGGGGGSIAPRQQDEEVLSWIADGRLRISVNDNEIHTFSGDRIQIGIRPLSRVEPVEQVFVSLGSQNIVMPFDPQTQRYQTSLTAPSVGNYALNMTIVYADEVRRDINIEFVVRGKALVSARGEDGGLEGVRVALYDAENFTVKALGTYNQSNPIITDGSGIYGFIVPNGTYFLRAEKEGYRTRETPVFTVRDAIVAQSIKLIPDLPDLAEQIDDILASNIAIDEKAVLVAGAVRDNVIQGAYIAAETIVDVKKQIDEIADDPVVEEAVEEVVTPVAAGAATVVVVPSLGGNLFPLLRYIFLQPFLLIGRKRRKAWGVVYNSLTKLPVDLAIIRLIDMHTGKVVQSRVTDSYGRFLFLADKGNYRIEVRKPSFQFPSKLLNQTETDGEFIDVYHGEEIVSSEKDATITPNIPLDPMQEGAQHTPARIIKERRIKIMREAVSISGVVLAGISFYISPTWYVGAFFGVHLTLYALFHRLAKGKRPKGWGIVREQEKSIPIGKAVVRLFSRQYNKLIATHVTDRKGRYAFLVGPNTYYIAAQKQGFTNYESDDIVVEENESGGTLLQGEISLKRNKKQETKNK